MLYLIRSAFAYAASSSAVYDGAQVGTLPPPNEAGAELLKMTRDLFRELASSAAGGKERGFLLGTLEVAREARARGWDEGQCSSQRGQPLWSRHLTADLTICAAVDSLPQLVGDYFEQFGTKMCCFDDLHPYLEALTAEERGPVREKMEAVAATAADGVCHIRQAGSSDRSAQLVSLFLVSQTLNTTQRVINASKVARYLAPVTDAAGESSATAAYLARYFEALPIGESPATARAKP
jgi:hypothetical protein